jgi:hypothetical protein
VGGCGKITVRRVIVMPMGMKARKREDVQRLADELGVTIEFVEGKTKSYIDGKPYRTYLDAYSMLMKIKNIREVKTKEPVKVLPVAYEEPIIGEIPEKYRKKKSVPYSRRRKQPVGPQRTAEELRKAEIARQFGIISEAKKDLAKMDVDAKSIGNLSTKLGVVVEFIGKKVSLDGSSPVSRINAWEVLLSLKGGNTKPYKSLLWRDKDE